jgi:hypothetical protein
MLFDLFKQMNSGVTMTSPTEEDRIKTAMTAFADDANLLGNDDGQTQNIDDRKKKNNERINLCPVSLIDVIIRPRHCTLSRADG